jgi:RNA-directed DNA polymerase
VSGPGDRAPKSCSTRESTCSHATEDHGVAPTRVDVVPTLSPESKEFGTFRKLPAREPGDLEGASPPMVGGRQPREGDEPRAAEQAFEESDAVIVPKKSAKTWVTPVELAEGRTKAEGKSVARNALPTQGGVSALTSLQRIGERARRRPKEKWTNLLSHIRVPLLTEAYRRLRKDAAPGVDDVTWEEYGEHLDARLCDLQDRIHRGSYHPQPVRRVHIPKGDGRLRPLGIPALEDKVVQQAVRLVLEPIYEAEFIGFSYGFRPRRSQHNALDALAEAISRKVNWVLDADIRSFYDTIDHGWLQRFLEHRIADARMIRLLMKWAKAGVMENDELHAVEEGTPQGGIISPLLSNIYLHYVLDLWVVSWRKKRARGEVYVVRYADDFTMCFQKEEDARAMHSALVERFAKFGLELHPHKTRVLEFGWFARASRERRGLGKPETFDFLGFTHLMSVTRHGKPQLHRRTSRKKRQAKLAELREACWKRRHDSAVAQHAWLCQVLQGHYRYYGVPTNYESLRRFQRRVEWTWHRSLQRRSHRAWWTTPRRLAFAAKFPLPKPHIYHPWPRNRFDEKRSLAR